MSVKRNMMAGNKAMKNENESDEARVLILPLWMPVKKNPPHHIAATHQTRAIPYVW
jgi:hypothetical protein